MLTFVIIIVFLITLGIISGKKTTKTKLQYNIPTCATYIAYKGGYDIPLSKILFFYHDNNALSFWDKKQPDHHITINKSDIINFSMIGEYSQTNSISGGGVSLGGAVVGGAILGPVGMVMGGRKKVKKIKSTTHTVDTRKTIIKFNSDKVEKGMIFDKKIYEILCFMCPEKKIV